MVVPGRTWLAQGTGFYTDWALLGVHIDRRKALALDSGTRLNLHVLFPSPVRDRCELVCGSDAYMIDRLIGWFVYCTVLPYVGSVLPGFNPGSPRKFSFLFSVGVHECVERLQPL